MMSMKRGILIFLIIVSFFSMGAVGSDKSAKKLKIVYIAHAANFSSESPTQINPLNSAYSDAARMATNEFERRFAKFGYEVRVLNFDHGPDNANTVKITEDIIKSNAVAVVGFYQSGKALLAAPILVKAGLQLVTPTTSALPLYEFGPLIRTLSISNRQMAQQMVKVAKKKLRSKNAFLVIESDCAYCVDLSKELELALAEANIKCVSARVKSDQANFDDILKIAKSNGFDLLVLPNQEASTAKVAKFLRDNEVKLPLLGGDGWGNNVTSGFFEMFSDENFVAYTIGHWSPEKANPHGKEFAEIWLNRFYREPTNAWAMVYEGTHFLLQSMYEMALKNIPLTRAAVAKKFETIKDYKGVVSRFVFEKPGGPPKRNIVILKANTKKKRFEPIELVWVE